jgi:hypothetical protein
VIGGYDASGELIAVHIDFFVILDPNLQEEVSVDKKGGDRLWWKFW